MELVGGEWWGSKKFDLKIGFKGCEDDSRVSWPQCTQEGEGGRRDGAETRRHDAVVI